MPNTPPPSRREWLFRRQHGRCYLCAGPMQPPQPQRAHQPIPDDVATIDHVIPKSAKAKGEPSLTLLACRRCNAEKGSRSPTLAQVEYAQAIAAEWLELTRDQRAAEKEDRRKQRAHRVAQALHDENAKAAKRMRRRRKRQRHASNVAARGR